jgi:hypothetical protein
MHPRILGIALVCFVPALATPSFAGDITIKGKVEFDAKPDPKTGAGAVVEFSGTCITPSSVTATSAGNYAATLACTGTGCVVTIKSGFTTKRVTVTPDDCTSGATFQVNLLRNECPCVNDIPGETTVVDCLEVRKSGQLFGTMTLECTNASQFGDYVRSWTDDQGNKKAIAKCVFEAGQNRHAKIPEAADPRNFKYLIHRCYDGGADDGEDWDMVLYAFDTKNCTLLRLCYERIGNDYVENAGARKTTNAADFDNFNDFQESVENLYEGLYNPLPADLEALDDGMIELIRQDAHAIPTLVWSVGDEHPELEIGDFIVLRGLDSADLVSWDSTFTLIDTADGLRLETTAVITPESSDVLLRFNSPYQGENVEFPYSIVNQAALPFWDAIFGGASIAENRFDRPDSAASAGTVNLGMAMPVPALGETGMIALTVAFVAAGAALLARRMG